MGNKALFGSSLFRPGIKKLSETLFVFRYPQLAPISGRFPVRKLTQRLRHHSLRRAISRLHMSDPIVIISKPEMVDLFQEMPVPKLCLYHVVDEYGSYSGVTPQGRQRLQKMEKTLISLVDGVIVTSPKLLEAKRAFHSRTYLVPNGVDYQAYPTALADPVLPVRLRSIPVPRLGYSGLVGDRLNLPMLKEIARKRPDWSLVFLGEIRAPQQEKTWRELIALPNVFYLGQVSIAEVPHYLKGFQVGLMPYHQDRHAEYIDPLKLYDYFAAGLPVASLDFPAARAFKEDLHVAGNPDEFEKAIESALADMSPERRQARRKTASRHTWEFRVERLSEIIQTILREKAEHRTGPFPKT